jgi:hypothetical protein
MKGKIELFYALPNIGAYLEKKGIPEQHLKPLIQMLIEGAAECHLKENLENLEGVIGHYLNEEKLDAITKITKETFDDLASMHCKVLVELDEHILDRTVEHLAKRKKK